MLRRTVRDIIRFLHDIGFIEYEWESMNWDDTAAIKSYLKEQLAEGHLSVEEEEFVDELMKKYDNSSRVREKVKDLLEGQEYLKVM